jgi:hypothetical protein
VGWHQSTLSDIPSSEKMFKGDKTWIGVKSLRVFRLVSSSYTTFIPSRRESIGSSYSQ